jgi:hypothetical protein
VLIKKENTMLEKIKEIILLIVELVIGYYAVAVLVVIGVLIALY